MFISIINGLSVKASENLQIISLLSNYVTTITSSVIGGFVLLRQGKTKNFENSFDGTSNLISAWAIAIYNDMSHTMSHAMTHDGY